MLTALLIVLSVVLLIFAALLMRTRAALDREGARRGKIETELAALEEKCLTLEGKVSQQEEKNAATEEKLKQEQRLRLEAEQHIKEIGNRWGRIVDAVPDPLLVVNQEQTVVLENAAARRHFLQNEAEQLVGEKCYRIFGVGDQPCGKCPIPVSSDTESPDQFVVEHTLENRTFQVSCVPMHEDGRLSGYVHTARDITTRRRLEQHLVQAQKMEAIATLAGGIAHDFNNILGAVLGNADLLLYRLRQGGDQPPGQTLSGVGLDEVLEHVEAIKKAGIRARDLVGQILTFSRQTTLSGKSVNLTPLVKEGVKLLRSSLPASIEVQADIAPSVGPVAVDPTQVHQILMNLATNSAQALEGRPGSISVTLDTVDADETFCQQYHGLEPGRYVRLSVADTGSGIPEPVLKRIFDPFFTTREVGEGTGMGLAVIHGIVTSHGGVIDVKSTPGEGSVFTVFLPVSQDEGPEGTDVATSMPRGNETILFVDDEEDIVKMRARMLEYLGYTVLTAGSGEDGLTLFEELEDSIDLVITDQTMTNMTGIDLAREIHRRNKRIPIILCSGYSEPVSPAGAQQFGVRRFLGKPLEMQQLSRAVRELLSAGDE